MLPLVIFLFGCDYSVIIDVHVCMLLQQTGSFYRGVLMNSKRFYVDWLATTNNTIGEYEVNITWHHIDGESNRTRIYELAKQLYFGN